MQLCASTPGCAPPPSRDEDASEAQLRFLWRLEAVSCRVWRQARGALCHMLTQLDMKNHISFQLPRTLRRKKKELELYKYKKHLSAQETLLCYFANDPYLYLHEKSDLMNYIGSDAPFCS